MHVVSESIAEQNPFALIFLQELPESILTQLDSCQKSNGLVHALNLFSTVLSKKSGVCAGSNYSIHHRMCAHFQTVIFS